MARVNLLLVVDAMGVALLLAGIAYAWVALPLAGALITNGVGFIVIAAYLEPRGGPQ